MSKRAAQMTKDDMDVRGVENFYNRVAAKSMDTIESAVKERVLFRAHFAVYAVSGGQCVESLYEYSHEGRLEFGGCFAACCRRLPPAKSGGVLQKVGSKDIATKYAVKYFTK